ncbi:MAG TPA: hypothetical protein VEI96_08485 [Thermodesulfovibrionales bacterium]|nr:hypothetical protein [Thermodesulfovibrionales bacterium]
MKNNKLLSSLLLILLCSPLTAVAEIDSIKTGAPHHIEVDKIEIDPDLRLKDRFDYSTYCGIIHSQRELNTLWSQLINIQDDFYHKFTSHIPKPPPVDFSKHLVIWFADRGVNASFVESLEITDNEGTNSLKAIIHVFHSDFGSSHLNLWKIPKTSKEIIIQVEHKYEERRGGEETPSPRAK